MQKEIVAQAIALLDTAPGPRTTVHAPFARKNDPAWRDRYGRIDPAEREHLLKLGDERRQRRASLKPRLRTGTSADLYGRV
jgi:D-proline reductase (dithiol) PrdB